MAKMKEKDLQALKREDVKENNWEIGQEPGTESQEPGARDQGSEEKQSPGGAKEYDFGGVNFEAMKSIAKIEAYAEGHSLMGLTIALIEIVKQKVDPEITANNPVWHWSICDDHCTFVFRSGQKVRVEL